MSQLSLFRFILTVGLVLGLTGCAGNGMQIGNSVSLCCPGNYANYRNYRIELREMPGFLSDYMLAEFETALQEKGLQRNTLAPDVVVRLTYRHINLNPEQEEVDPFERRTDQDIMLRYVATIDIEMLEQPSGDIVWAGQVNRIHTVTPGEYMHEENARPEMLAAFRDLLTNYPAPER